MAITLPPRRDDTGSIMYKVYILKSQIADKHYIGSTKNLEERLQRHNQGRNKWTKRHKPWEVIHTEEYDTKKEAQKREKIIKSYKGGKAFKKLIENAGVV